MVKTKVNISSPPRRVMFAESNDSGECIGLVELIILPDILGRRSCGYIHKVYVDAEFRGEGLASKLVDNALTHAEKNGCHKVFLICDEKMVSFYEKLGMEKDQVVMTKRF